VAGGDTVAFGSWPKKSTSQWLAGFERFEPANRTTPHNEQDCIRSAKTVADAMALVERHLGQCEPEHFGYNSLSEAASQWGLNRGGFIVGSCAGSRNLECVESWEIK